MATLLKVLNNLADIKSAGGVALRVRTQGSARPAPRKIAASRWTRQVSEAGPNTPSICPGACASISRSSRSRSSRLTISRCIGHQTSSRARNAVFGHSSGSSPEPPGALLKRSDRAEKVDSAELWPVHIGEVELAVSALSQQEAGQTNLPTCADDEVRVRQPYRVEVVVDRQRRDRFNDCL